jgi:hypothetical protein
MDAQAQFDGVGWPEAGKTVAECQSMCEDQPGCSAWWSYAADDGVSTGDCYIAAGNPTVATDAGRPDRTVGTCTFN